VVTLWLQLHPGARFDIWLRLLTIFHNAVIARSSDILRKISHTIVNFRVFSLQLQIVENPRYESRGQRFESFRARQLKLSLGYC
jgi:hypothetical protein